MEPVDIDCCESASARIYVSWRCLNAPGFNEKYMPGVSLCVDDVGVVESNPVA